MESWKKAVVAGSAGAAAILFLKKRYPAGVLAAGVGLAVLASEYPEKFEDVRSLLPDYFERGMRSWRWLAKPASARSAPDKAVTQGIWDRAYLPDGGSYSIPNCFRASVLSRSGVQADSTRIH